MAAGFGQRNLTPHRLCVIDTDGTTVLDLAASAAAARITQGVVAETAVEGALIRTIRYGSRPTFLRRSPERCSSLHEWWLNRFPKTTSSGQTRRYATTPAG